MTKMYTMKGQVDDDVPEEPTERGKVQDSAFGNEKQNSKMSLRKSPTKKGGSPKNVIIKDD